MLTMQPIVRLGPDDQNPFPLLITTSRQPKNGTISLVENFRVEEMPWSDPVGAALRDAQQAELDIRYGEPGKEPGIKPTADNIALFLVAYPVPIIDNSNTTAATKLESTPIACGSLRDLGDGYMEIKRMYAVESVRGTGAALSVLIALERYARATGVKVLRLETGDRQQDAMKFYERNGYASIPKFGHYKHVPWSNCYEKTLDATV
ncbi:hypothetical protein BDV93DRAFT_610284 [Ceratobasidium sp. AG-I]|nr:hypothetical protein BDV93DRAFT_610284 [Ceratobasidium sp. AG-I]